MKMRFTTKQLWAKEFTTVLVSTAFKVVS